MAMGALAVSAASSDFGHLYAQQSKGAAPAKSAPANIPLPLRRFDIPAGPFEEAAPVFRRSPAWTSPYGRDRPASTGMVFLVS